MTPGDTRRSVNAHTGTPYRGGQALDVSAMAHAHGDRDTRGATTAPIQESGWPVRRAARRVCRWFFCGPRRVLTPGDVPPSSVVPNKNDFYHGLLAGHGTDPLPTVDVAQVELYRLNRPFDQPTRIVVAEHG